MNLMRINCLLSKQCKTMRHYSICRGRISAQTVLITTLCTLFIQFAYDTFLYRHKMGTAGTTLVQHLPVKIRLSTGDGSVSCFIQISIEHLSIEGIGTSSRHPLAERRLEANRHCGHYRATIIIIIIRGKRGLAYQTIVAGQLSSIPGISFRFRAK